MSKSIQTEFSAFEYLLISIANAAGKDKLLFEERIEWCLVNAKKLPSMVESVDDKHLFMRGLIELNNVRKGVSTGYMVGLDGTASGLQCLSALSGCHTTASQVNLVDPDQRKDPYTGLIGNMNHYLHPDNHISLGKGIGHGGFTRDDVKQPFMTHYYASKKVPENTFGAGSVELTAFYKALAKMNPGAEDLMLDFFNCMDNSSRTFYGWTMPDKFNSRCNVIAKSEHQVEIDELLNRNGNKSTITHMQNFIGLNSKYVANPANATHSVDGLVVREMHRRMNYDPVKLQRAYEEVKGSVITDTDNFPTLRMCDWLSDGQGNLFSESQGGQLALLIEQVLEFKPAPLVTIHDEFKTYPSACGAMRYNYREILANIAESKLAEQMLQGMYEDDTLEYPKHSLDLGNVIRGSRYAIC